jgi:hypothetical protein
MEGEAQLREIDYEERIRQSPEFALRESSAHFDANNAVWRTLNRLAKDLDEAGIPYALVGAMALNQHGYARMTTDVDIIMTREGLEQFRARFIGRGYRPQFEGALKTFRDTETQVRIEVILAGGFPGDGKPKPVAFPDPSEVIMIRGVRVVTFEKLLDLKLASGMTAPHRLSDLGDVQKVIKALNLPLDFSAKLDPSVRGEYERLWHTVNDAPDVYDEEAQMKLKRDDTAN